MTRTELAAKWREQAGFEENAAAGCKFQKAMWTYHRAVAATLQRCANELEETEMTEELAAMMEAIDAHNAGGWLTGDDPVALVATDWVEWGFTPGTAVPYWNAGCFLPEETAQLRDNDVTPEQAEMVHNDLGDTIGYHYCNGDISMKTVLELTA